MRTAIFVCVILAVLGLLSWLCVLPMLAVTDIGTHQQTPAQGIPAETVRGMLQDQQQHSERMALMGYGSNTLIVYAFVIGVVAVFVGLPFVLTRQKAVREETGR